jgi:ring-1,2-phenylacetyl-CoA epoxidase subunit PaaA
MTVLAFPEPAVQPPGEVAMAVKEQDLLKRTGAGRAVTAPSQMSPAYRGEVTRLMTIFVDTELAWAAGYADYINEAPGIRERVVAAQVVREKLGHAEAILALLEPFYVRPGLYVRSHAWSARLDRNVDLGNRRIGDDKRLNVLHCPNQGWTDAVVANLLIGISAPVHLGELAGCSYAPLAKAMKTIVKSEAEHARLAEKGVKQAIEREGSTAAAQVSVNYWYPRVAATFGVIGSERFRLYKSYRLRRHTNAELLARWKSAAAQRLKALKLKAPKTK